jgi:hypothetical protein
MGDYLSPPYTNRWGAIPGPDYRRCKGTTQKGEQCRRGAIRGHDYCPMHSAEDEFKALPSVGETKQC